MLELKPGLWRWEAPHPEWTPGTTWPQDVASYALDDGTRLILFDPLGVPEEILALMDERQAMIVLTSAWHERDSESLVERFGLPVYAPTPDTAEELIAKEGLSAEEAANGGPDLRWLKQGTGDAHWYDAGDPLPAEIVAYPGREPNDVVLWVPSVNAVIAGDTLPDLGKGMDIDVWLHDHVSRDAVIEQLSPLLSLPVELVLPTHGPPTDLNALSLALSPS
jgi:glyoxylase-like metal-dependent hydrolase (beta-lactamase superfamily II)